MDTEEDIYNPGNIPLYEALYGKNLISLGGVNAIDNLFSGIDLNNSNILDVGFGLGGLPYYLAKKYHIQISGVEVQEWMVNYATSHAPEDIAHLLKFTLYNDAGELPFKNETFDLIYSKGVLNHVHDKIPLFIQINRTLKNQGMFVIADWISPRASTNGPLVNETEESYRKALTIAGFKNSHFQDDSSIFITYVEQLLTNLKHHREFIKKEFGNEFYTIIQNDHTKLLEEIRNKNKFAVRIVTNK